MSNLDIRIDELSSETDAHLLRSSQPLGWLGLSRSTRKGRLKNVVWLITGAHLLLLVLAIWVAIRFFAATDVMAAVKYGLSAAVLAIMSLQLKLSLMPHIQAERVLRELKRVEILVLSRTSDPKS